MYHRKFEVAEKLLFNRIVKNLIFHKSSRRNPALHLHPCDHVGKLSFPTKKKREDIKEKKNEGKKYGDMLLKKISNVKFQ